MPEFILEGLGSDDSRSLTHSTQAPQVASWVQVWVGAFWQLHLGEGVRREWREWRVWG